MLPQRTSKAAKLFGVFSSGTSFGAGGLPVVRRRDAPHPPVAQGKPELGKPLPSRQHPPSAPLSAINSLSRASPGAGYAEGVRNNTPSRPTSLKIAFPTVKPRGETVYLAGRALKANVWREGFKSDSGRSLPQFLLRKDHV